jgi:hypothetical protein
MNDLTFDNDFYLKIGFFIILIVFRILMIIQ